MCEETFNRNQHSVYKLTYHAVFVTKYRRPVITEKISGFMKEELTRLLEMKGGGLVEYDSDKDHIHLLFETMPSTAPSVLVNSLKTQLSKAVRAKFPDDVKKYLWGDAFWTESYFICTTGGASIDTVRRYIEGQQTEVHRRKYEKSGKYKKGKKK